MLLSKLSAFSVGYVSKKWDEWARELTLCNSYDVLPHYLATYWQYPPKMALRMLGKIWSRCDNLAEFREELELGPFLLSDSATVVDMMTMPERRLLKMLPDEFVIWRGCYKRNVGGLSWSMHRDVAEQFPFLHRYRVANHRPLLVRALVRKRAVVAVKLDRNEAEIIAHGPQVESIVTARDKEGRFRWVAKEGRIVDTGQTATRHEVKDSARA